MGKKRLFIAIDLSAAARKKIYGICGNIAGIRWTKQGQLHLTLRFIGDFEEAVIPELSGVLSNIKFKAFELDISGTGFFRSSIFFLNLEESAALSSLKQQVDETLYRFIGGQPGAQEFMPHITLARFKRPLRTGKRKFLTRSFEQILPEKFIVDKFILYSSELDQEEAVHIPLLEVKTISRR